MFQTAAITFLYLLSIFGWGEVLCACLSRWEKDFSDYIAGRLLLGCFGLYAAFILLSAGGLLHRLPVVIVLACGLVPGIIRLRVAGRKLTEAVGETAQWPVSFRLILAAICCKFISSHTPPSFIASRGMP